MRRAPAVWGAWIGLAAGCFQSDFLAGLPCENDSECGKLSCENGFCGGPATGATTNVETSATETAETSSSDDAVTIEPDTSFTTVDPDTEETTATDTGDICPPACPCMPPQHEPCDADANSLVLALGLACPDEADVESSQVGSVQGRTTRTEIGGFSAREGSRFAVLGSGLVNELTEETPDFDIPSAPTFCNDDQGAFDVGTLPDPMTSMPTPESCDDPGIVGLGDCSGSLEDEIVGDIQDYSALTIGVRVPDGIRSFSFDFAFSSLEYPASMGAFNDLFVAWLVSETWTGNVSFDGDDAISVNSNLLTITDDDMTEPMFSGTCFRGHASTGWLTTTAPVVAGEDMTLVFAVFDQVDSAVDSFVFLDAFRWNCSPVPAPETHS